MTRQDRPRRSRRPVAVPRTTAEWEALTPAEFAELEATQPNDWDYAVNPWKMQAIRLKRVWPPPDEPR